MLTVTGDGRICDIEAAIDMPVTEFGEFQPVRRKVVVIGAMEMGEPFQCEDEEGSLQPPGDAGDYLMRGADGEYYCCRRAVFQAMYEKVEA